MTDKLDVDTKNTPEKTPILKADPSTLQDNEELISALAKQLRYYLSSQNLAKDTYLNTIMQLTSGFVPVSILAGFANVNRILARYAGEIDIADINVQGLLHKSALSSDALKIVLIDQEGKVLATHGDDGFEAQKGALTFEAIGSCSEYVASADAKDEGSAAAQSGEEKKASTVILRDVPEKATEEDIRNVFKGGDAEVVAPVITDVQKEVGQCWFVTVDASTSQQDLVSILLQLRSKTICGEPIKARLKTQSNATQGTPMQGSGWNPYRSRYQGYNNQIYSGDRMHNGSRKFNNKPFSKQRGGKGSDSASYKGVDAKKGLKIVDKAAPPPPLVEEHFPGLSGSPKSTASPGQEEDDTNNAEPKKEIVTASGYAAALLKEAPPFPDVRSVPTEKRSLPKPSSPLRKIDDAKSTGTASTDGSSADDKSSASKADSESPSANVPSPAKSWGGGRSFADILKKQELETK